MTSLSTKSAYTLAAIAGAAGWIVAGSVGGRHEAWDSPLYFAWVLPSLCVIVATIAFFAPERPGRLAMVPFAVQVLVAFVQNRSRTVLPAQSSRYNRYSKK